MYSLASKMHGLPIISLQSGEAVAWTKEPVIDMATLEILAFMCQTASQKAPLVLMTRDVRQLAVDCLIIDNEEELTDPEDIVRLRSLIADAFSPLDKPVVSDMGRKLGTVEDYTINLETNKVQKLYLRQSLFRAWLGTSLIIDRSQIIDVTPKKITVRDATVKAPVAQPVQLPETPA